MHFWNKMNTLLANPICIYRSSLRTVLSNRKVSCKSNTRTFECAYWSACYDAKYINYIWGVAADWEKGRASCERRPTVWRSYFKASRLHELALGLSEDQNSSRRGSLSCRNSSEQWKWVGDLSEEEGGGRSRHKAMDSIDVNFKIEQVDLVESELVDLGTKSNNLSIVILTSSH